MRLTITAFFILLFTAINAQTNCNCNEKEIEFSEAYVNTNQLIFRGKTISTSEGTDYDKVTFTVDKLFKGTAFRQTEVYFDAKNPCILKFNPGEDWLIYANYKSGKPLLAFCSRSRKNIINTNKNVELMYVKSDITVDDETDKLIEMCGVKNLSEPIANSESAHDNIIPNGLQRILMIIFSLIGFAVIYYVLNKVMKK